VPLVIGTTRDPLPSAPFSDAPSDTDNQNVVDGATATAAATEEGPSSQRRVKTSVRVRERSLSPCPLNRARSSGPAPRGHHHHKTLDRADTVATASGASRPSHPPRYSLLSVRSSSVETCKNAITLC
jgi:hypothetical protein